MICFLVPVPTLLATKEFASKDDFTTGTVCWILLVQGQLLVVFNE